MRACFNAAGIPKEKQKLIWTECANYICDTENIMVKGGKTKAPHQLMNNNEARYVQNLHSFGNMAVIRDIKKNIKAKLDNRGKLVMFVGYAKSHSGNVLRFLNINSSKIILSCDVKWLGITYGEYKSSKNKEIIIENNNHEVTWDDQVDTSDDEPGENEVTNFNPTPNTIQERYNLRPRSNNSINNQEDKGDNIPREIRNLETSYNDATKIYESFKDGDAYLALPNSQIKNNFQK